MRSFWLLLDNNSLLKVYHLVYKCKNILNCALENMICALCTSNCAPNKFGANRKLSSLGLAFIFTAQLLLLLLLAYMQTD